MDKKKLSLDIPEDEGWEKIVKDAEKEGKEKGQAIIDKVMEDLKIKKGELRG